MKLIFRGVLLAACWMFATQAAAQIIFYERENFEGKKFFSAVSVPNFAQRGFNNRASSIEVNGARWQVCEGANYTGRCVNLTPGKYASLSVAGLNNSVSSARVVPPGASDVPHDGNENNYRPGPAAAARITFYEREGFEGRSFTAERSVRFLETVGFNNRASSAEVVGRWWEVCEGTRYEGRCAVLRPGRYPTLAAMGLGNTISSVQLRDRSARIDVGRYAPAPVAVHDGRDYRRRKNERLYEADVVSVRAVVGTPEQRCWVEREQVQSRPNVGGAIAGAVIGGILGHQIGSGSGQDVATAGGAVAGAAIGANVNRGGRTQDVQRCSNVPGSARAEYWDVVYTFRGREHRVQMTSPPGRTVTVNQRGEPRA